MSHWMFCYTCVVRNWRISSLHSWNTCIANWIDFFATQVFHGTGSFGLLHTRMGMMCSELVVWFAVRLFNVIGWWFATRQPFQANLMHMHKFRFGLSQKQWKSMHFSPAKKNRSQESYGYWQTLIKPCEFNVFRLLERTNRDLSLVWSHLARLGDH